MIKSIHYMLLSALIRKESIGQQSHSCIQRSRTLICSHQSQNIPHAVSQVFQKGRVKDIYIYVCFTLIRIQDKSESYWESVLPLQQRRNGP